MEEKFKKIFWISFIPLGLVLVGTLFGILASVEMVKLDAKDSGLKILQYVMITIILIAAIISIISGVINAISLRNGHVKNAVLATARTSTVQFFGPFVSFILAIIGLAKANAAPWMYIFLVITFCICTFASLLIFGTLKSFKKDKENYTYISTVAFIAAGTFLIFLIASLVGQLKIGEAGGTDFVGFLICFSLFFNLGDAVSYINLGILSKDAAKNAPKVTEESADSTVFKEMTSNLEGIKKELENKQVAPKDNVAELRKYKQLLDEGIITKEEFETKKKELL